MLIGINPLVGYICKKLFGDPMHSSITLHFINAILRNEPQITKIEILNPIMDKDYDAVTSSFDARTPDPIPQFASQ